MADIQSGKTEEITENQQQGRPDDSGKSFGF